MKTNIKIFLLTILLSTILFYPFGHLLNIFIFHQVGGGLDVGLDTASVEIIIGVMFTLPLLSFLILGTWGKGYWRWLFAVTLSLPSFVLFMWSGVYLLLPSSALFIGYLISLLSRKYFRKSEVIQ